MPRLGGVEATRQIRADPRYATVPIIGITGDCSPSSLQRCVDAGMTAAMGKPIDTLALLALLIRHLTRPQLSFPSRSQSPPPPSFSEHAPPPEVLARLAVHLQGQNDNQDEMPHTGSSLSAGPLLYLP